MKGLSSGGMKLIVSGQNLDVVQKPMIKSIYNSSVYEFISVSEGHTSENSENELFFDSHVKLFHRHK